MNAAQTKFLSSVMLRSRICGFLAVAAIVVWPFDSQAQAPAVEPPAETANDILLQMDRAITALFERVSPSVVQITTFAKGSNATEFKYRSGSGLFWDRQGHIVTNAHVLQDATEIGVWLSSSPSDAVIVGVAPNFDLAVIRVKGMTAQPSPIVLGSAENLKVGQLAFAIGSPFGLDQSLSWGVISALNRRLPTAKGRSIANIIQTDVAMYPGNSGGPLLDSQGKLIGINTIAYSMEDSGAAFGFAIPVEIVKRVVPLLIRDGRVPTPGIGIIPGKEEIAIREGIKGVVIDRIHPNSPAERADLRTASPSGMPADIIVAANGQPVGNVYELTNQLERIGVGGEIILQVRRGNTLIDVTVPIIDIDLKS